jgi:hypothetical protein
MEQRAMHILDIELTASDVQAFNGADAIAAFFVRLGYHTEARTFQAPANLGMTADGIVRPIKRIELIADQEGLFQIYLVELASITVAHTRALARAFRNRAGNYLLVLTNDYEYLDFVLLERYLPSGSANGTTRALCLATHGGDRLTGKMINATTRLPKKNLEPSW